jgi:hypothetical protein
MDETEDAADGDYPFHGLDAVAIAGFLQTLPDRGDQTTQPQERS